MKLYLKIAIILALFFQMPQLLAQPTSDGQLAVYYYQNGEYEKAAIYYEKLLKETGSDFYYDYYLKCLIKLEDFKNAEKVAKKQIKKFPNTNKFRVDLGLVYESAGEENKANAEYDKAIKTISDYRESIKVAGNFKTYNKLDFALSAYLKGKKLAKGIYPFQLYIAEIYGTKGNTEDMIKEYLELLEENASNYEINVQNSLLKSINFENEEDEGIELLRKELLKKAQKEPNNQVYGRMLIWFFTQRQDFESAFIQVKGLDRKAKSKGNIVYKFANTCTNNEKYDLAIEAYEYVIEKNESEKDNEYNFLYDNSKREILNVYKRKITEGKVFTKEDLLELEAKYNSTIDELKNKSVIILPLMLDLARLQAFYLHDVTTARTVLNEALKLPGATKRDEAKCKLLLGDVLILDGDIWEAGLYFMQVEKDFKHDVLGHQAKFKGAKVFYYDGDFGWAQSQLNVLKASTSKLISNDALELSLLITDNMKQDSVSLALEMYAKADLLEYQNKDKEALAILDTMELLFAFHDIQDEVLFKRYEISGKRGEYDNAAKYLLAIINNPDFSEDILADNALFHLAKLYEDKLGDEEQAQKYYKKLMFEYSNSFYAAEARKRYRFLRGEEKDKPGGIKILEEEDVN